MSKNRERKLRERKEKEERIKEDIKSGKIKRVVYEERNKKTAIPNTGLMHLMEFDTKKYF